MCARSSEETWADPDTGTLGLVLALQEGWVLNFSSLRL